MPADPECQPASEPDRLEAATDQAVTTCGGDARDAVKALIVANEFLEAQVEELRADVSNGCARGYYHGRTSQRTQVVRHIAEFPIHLGIAEIAGGGITRATERNRADVTLLARQRLGGISFRAVPPVEAKAATAA